MRPPNGLCSRVNCTMMSLNNNGAQQEWVVGRDAKSAMASPQRYKSQESRPDISSNLGEKLIDGPCAVESAHPQTRILILVELCAALQVM
jgi:hypothetical protein